MGSPSGPGPGLHPYQTVRWSPMEVSPPLRGVAARLLSPSKPALRAPRGRLSEWLCRQQWPPLLAPL